DFLNKRFTPTEALPPLLSCARGFYIVRMGKQNTVTQRPSVKNPASASFPSRGLAKRVDSSDRNGNAQIQKIILSPHRKSRSIFLEHAQIHRAGLCIYRENRSAFPLHTLMRR
ncbi:MAG TPA: hypothetical protein VMU78_06350, partial [Methylocella sp.]|nr:hypothetical protein [Methylocella sp.]